MPHKKMHARLAQSWVSPERGCRLPPLTEEQLRLVQESCELSAKNHVIHVEIKPVGAPPFHRNTVWEALRAVGSTAKTASYGTQQSLSMRLRDPPIECTVIVSHTKAGTPETTNIAEEAATRICVLGVKDFATACIVARTFVSQTVYQLTGRRFLVKSVSPCNTLFVGKINGVHVNLTAMAARLGPLYCTRHTGIDCVTMTCQVIVDGAERTATCNVWATGAVNILGMPDYECNRVAMDAFAPTIVRFASVVADSVQDAAPTRASTTSAIDRQMSWGRAEASRWLVPGATHVRVHPQAKPGLVLGRERIQPGLPVPRASWFVERAERDRADREANQFMEDN